MVAPLPVPTTPITDGLWAALAKSQQEGLWGNQAGLTGATLGLPQAAFDPWIDINLPRPYTIPWLVTLKQMRFNTQTIGGPPLIATIPADNQISTSGLVGPGPFEGGPYAQIQWGNDVGEVALVDYPWGGGSFVLVARWLRVQLYMNPWQPGQNLPILGAFATPLMGHAGGGAVERPGPRYTNAENVLSPTNPHLDFPVPARASAYRVLSNTAPSDAVPGATGSGYTARAEQRDAVGDVFVTDYDGTFGLATINDPASASRWWPLVPQATIVRLTASDPTADTPVQLQFSLDLS